MISENAVYEIGSITRTHGVRGEVAFLFTDDVWDRVEADYLFLRLDGLLVPFFLEEWRFRSDTVALLKFEDIDSANAAARLVGAAVYFPKELTPGEVAEDDITWRMFTGFQVFVAKHQAALPADGMQEGELLGTVTDVDDRTANILLYITTPAGGELIIPAVEEFVISADHKARTLLVDIPDELLTLND